MRVYSRQVSELAVEELADHFAEPRIVLRKSRGIESMTATAGGKEVVKQIHLRALAAAIDALEGDQPAKRALIYFGMQTSLD